jgi:sulfite reductase (ferredoxin)
MGTIPAKNVPVLLADFVSGYKNERASGEDFYAFLNRYGKNRMSFLIEKHSHIPSYEENRDYYVDFDATEDFSLVGRGVGECGAGVFDMIETDIANAKKAIAEAESFDETCIDLFECLYNGAASAARALLVTQGVEAKNEREVFNFFEEKFIDKGLADKKFLNLFALTPKNIREQGKSHYVALAQELNETVQNLYDNMDNSLRFQKKSDDTPQEAPSESRKFLDLRGTECPFNYVKTKLFMEEMEMGEIIEVLLDAGAPIENVPKSLDNDGQNVKEIIEEGDHFKIVVEKVV